MRNYRAILELLILKIGGRYSYTVFTHGDSPVERFEFTLPFNDREYFAHTAEQALDILIDALLMHDFDYGRLLWDLFRPSGDSPNEGGDA